MDETFGCVLVYTVRKEKLSADGLWYSAYCAKAFSSQDSFGPWNLEVGGEKVVSSCDFVILHSHSNAGCQRLHGVEGELACHGEDID